MAALIAIWFQHYGLGAVFALLLLENFGLPVPGETVLLYAAYLAQTRAAFGWTELVAVASFACILGQTAGYLLGRHFAPWVRRRLRPQQRRVETTERYFRRHGAATVLFARFFAGVRVVVGPVAGLSRMPLRTFLAFSTLGALLWAGLLTAFAAALTRAFGRLARVEQALGRLDAALLAAAVLLVLLAWYVRRRRRAHE